MAGDAGMMLVPFLPYRRPGQQRDESSMMPTGVAPFSGISNVAASRRLSRFSRRNNHEEMMSAPRYSYFVVFLPVSCIFRFVLPVSDVLTFILPAADICHIFHTPPFLPSSAVLSPDAC